MARIKNINRQTPHQTVPHQQEQATEIRRDPGQRAISAMTIIGARDKLYYGREIPLVSRDMPRHVATNKESIRWNRQEISTPEDTLPDIENWWVVKAAVSVGTGWTTASQFKGGQQDHSKGFKIDNSDQRVYLHEFLTAATGFQDLINRLNMLDKDIFETSSKSYVAAISQMQTELNDRNTNLDYAYGLIQCGNVEDLVFELACSESYSKIWQAYQHNDALNDSTKDEVFPLFQNSIRQALSGPSEFEIIDLKYQLTETDDCFNVELSIHPLQQLDEILIGAQLESDRGTDFSAISPKKLNSLNYGTESKISFEIKKSQLAAHDSLNIFVKQVTARSSGTQFSLAKHQKASIPLNRSNIRPNFRSAENGTPLIVRVRSIFEVHIRALMRKEHNRRDSLPLFEGWEESIGYNNDLAELGIHKDNQDAVMDALSSQEVRNIINKSAKTHDEKSVMEALVAAIVQTLDNDKEIIERRVKKSAAQKIDSLVNKILTES